MSSTDQEGYRNWLAKQKNLAAPKQDEMERLMGIWDELGNLPPGTSYKRYIFSRSIFNYGSGNRETANVQPPSPKPAQEQPTDTLDDLPLFQKS